MNTLISRLMQEGIMQSPFENWQDENRCKAIEYVSEHFNCLPYGELGQLIAEQAMDDHRVKVQLPADLPTCDDAFASDAWTRGTAEINSFMGFDYDEVEQAFHATRPNLYTTDPISKQIICSKAGQTKDRRDNIISGLQWQISHGRCESWQPKPVQHTSNTPTTPIRTDLERRIEARRQYRVAAFV